MVGEDEWIKQALSQPDSVVDPEPGSGVWVYQELIDHPKWGRKYLRAVVKCSGDDCFLVTAHFARQVKHGMVIWTKR